MERELQELKAELERRNATRAGRAKARTAPSTRARQRAGAAQPRTATAPAAAPPTGRKPAPVATAQTPAGARRDAHADHARCPFIDRVRIGGYGSIRFEASDNPARTRTPSSCGASCSPATPHRAAAERLLRARVRALPQARGREEPRARRGRPRRAQQAVEGTDRLRDLARADLAAVRHRGLAQVPRRRRAGAARPLQHQSRRQPLGHSAPHAGRSRRAGAAGRRRRGTSSASASSATSRSPTTCCSTTRRTS